ncbi:PhzF family phenazine biosynthesis protein [Actinomycetospora atypica]|uniref:PhzF family phenazine biosynthesis protein n=1 Tax=Actinomycetospora atypica TaxID=1290095 RepID=A0ABV9YRM3_9PSEU
MTTGTRSSGPVEVLRYTAFTTTPAGGNPAGVVLRADGLDPAGMARIAADVGFSETAFLSAAPPDATPAPDETHCTVRYFSPRAEVPFCGHATIAAAVARAAREGTGTLVLHTRSGRVPVRTRWEGDALTATLTSVPPRVLPVDDADVDRTLDLLGWRRDELDPRLPPRVAFAGAHHLVLAAATRSRLARLEYDLEALGELMAARDWTTLQLVHRTGPRGFDVRDPFPPGGVFEDAATGAAAAALGAYLADLGAIEPPVRLTLAQGHDMGRPSTLLVDVAADPGRGVDVTGSAVPLA